MCFVSSLFLSFSPFFLLVSLLFWRIRNSNKLRYFTISIFLLFMVVLSGFLYLNLARPGIHIWPEKTPFYEVQLWAKNNTPKDAVFITPPSKWWLYDIEWRVVSERSTVSTLSELLEAAFDPGYIHYWKPRFEDIAPNVLNRFQGDYLDNLRMTSEAYYTNTSESFLRVGKKYNAYYLVAGNRHRYNLPILFENKEYTVYSLKYPAR